MYRCWDGRFFLKFTGIGFLVAKMISELTYHGVFFESFFRRNRENIHGKIPTLLKEFLEGIEFYGHCSPLKGRGFSDGEEST